MALPLFVSTVTHPDGTTSEMATYFPATRAVIARVLRHGADTPRWQVMAWARDEEHAAHARIDVAAPALDWAGYRGEGMQIAVFDAGFPGVDRLAGLQRLQTQGRVASTRNFVDGGRSVYLRNSHGTSTLSLIGGEQPGSFVGTAPRATLGRSSNSAGTFTCPMP